MSSVAYLIQDQDLPLVSFKISAMVIFRTLRKSNAVSTFQMIPRSFLMNQKKNEPMHIISENQINELIISDSN